MSTESVVAAVQIVAVIVAAGAMIVTLQGFGGSFGWRHFPTTPSDIQKSSTTSP
jgi:hypothetical protein